VAFWAHIGGFVAGAVMDKLLANPPQAGNCCVVVKFV